MTSKDTNEGTDDKLMVRLLELMTFGFQFHMILEGVPEELTPHRLL